MSKGYPGQVANRPLNQNTVSQGSDANPTAIAAGNPHWKALAAVSTPYRQASLAGLKAGADANTAPSDNTGLVYVALAASPNLGTAWRLAPGGVLVLPDGGDLADYVYAVVTAADGVCWQISQ